MRRVMHFDSSTVLPPQADVLRRLELPAGAPVSAQLRTVLDQAEASFRRAAEPRGVVQELPPGDFEPMYRGDGNNAEATPLETIVPQAAALALFVGTLGRGVTDETEAFFRDGDPSLALILDAYACEAANRLAYLLATEYLDALRQSGRADDATRVLPYSPGYCGWHVSGQRTLFSIIRPEDIGVSIKKSCLMVPLKSVSGIMVAGGAPIHRFRPAYAFCDECSTMECVQRMLSIRQ